jgi:hypothetical protein
MKRAALGVIAALVVLVAGTVDAAAVSRPSVAIDHSVVRVGDRLLVTLTGWPAQRAVNIAVCGNGARRGSVDCNLGGSQGYGISAFDKVHATEFVITTPPVPCPCVIQVANTTQTEVAYAPITIAGFATAAVVGNVVASPLAVSVSVHRASHGLFGWVRSSLGGPTSYDLTVTVRNRVGEKLTALRLIARAGRQANDQARRVRIKGPVELAPGQSWTHEERVRLPAPVLGRFVWTVSAVGVGPIVTSRTTSDHVPLLFDFLVVVLIGDLMWIAYRRVRRGIVRRR